MASAQLATAVAPQPEAHGDAEQGPAERGDVYQWLDQRLGERTGVHDQRLDEAAESQHVCA